jgi:S1-C subfamily serine protease
MKHKIISAILISAFCTCAILFSSCTGEPGKSAYQIALDNGFSGSEQEWLQSLHGKDGIDGRDGENGRDGLSYVEKNTTVNVDINDLYDAACQKGYTGSLLDFISEYITVSSNANEQFAANRALLSTVSIQCIFYKDEQIIDAEGQPQTIAVPYTNAGAGVIYKLDRQSGDAYIITNYHIVYKHLTNTGNNISEEIKVYLNGMKYLESAIEASYVGGSMTYDIAVLKVSGNEILKNSNAEAAVFTDSNDITVGQKAIAVGNPMGSGLSVTSGIVSVDSEYIAIKGSDERTDLSLRSIRVDTPVNSGNSGGGLYNSSGEIIGIVNVKDKLTTVENIGYAIPSNIAVGVAENILHFSELGGFHDGVNKSYLGITMIIKNSRSVYDYKTQSARIYEDCTVDSVVEDSGAYGLVFPGDVIMSISANGKSVEATRLFTVVDFMLDVYPGDTVTLHVKRGDGEIDIEIPLTDENIIIYE